MMDWLRLVAFGIEEKVRTGIASIYAIFFAVMLIVSIPMLIGFLMEGR